LAGKKAIDPRLSFLGPQRLQMALRRTLDTAEQSFSHFFPSGAGELERLIQYCLLVHCDRLKCVRSDDKLVFMHFKAAKRLRAAEILKKAPPPGSNQGAPLSKRRGPL